MQININKTKTMYIKTNEEQRKNINKGNMVTF